MNQYLTEGDFNQCQRYELHEIYRDVQERAENKHANEWIIPKWESNMTFTEWDDYLLNMMENEKFSANKHTPIQYLIRKH